LFSDGLSPLFIKDLRFQILMTEILYYSLTIDVIFNK